MALHNIDSVGLILYCSNNINTIMSDKSNRWDILYASSGLDRNWSQPLVEDYGTEILSKYSDNIAPHNLIGFDILNLNQNDLQRVLPRDLEISVSEYLSLIIDVLNCFSQSSPYYDKEIHNFYTNLESNFDLDDFEGFYILCRNVNQVNIEETNTYKIINEVNKEYNFDNSVPEIGSKWEVIYKGSPLVVSISGSTPLLDEDIIDPNMYCYVENSQSGSSVEEGQNIQLSPKYFNEGVELSSVTND